MNNKYDGVRQSIEAKRLSEAAGAPRGFVLQKWPFSTSYIYTLNFHGSLTDYGNPVSMIDEEFEWDDDEAASNVAKHGVAFEAARAVFRDPFAVEFLDDREDYGERRYILMGMSAAALLVVVHTERGERYRIISARKAEPNERRYYLEADQRS